ncbi:MAG: hypothetical protein EOP04_17005 [Proteobacteria bacterium]|nr:MAG: hypothetical protein EOP04_17005 [Pseudomonadota bacterium]
MNTLRFALSLVTALVCIFSQGAWAKRIIIDEQDLAVTFFVTLTHSQKHDDLLKQVNKSLDFGNGCDANRSMGAVEEKDSGDSDYIKRFRVTITSTCLSSALYLYEDLRKDSRFSIGFWIPKPAVTGSN